MDDFGLDRPNIEDRESLQHGFEAELHNLSQNKSTNNSHQRKTIDEPNEHEL